MKLFANRSSASAGRATRPCRAMQATRPMRAHAAPSASRPAPCAHGNVSQRRALQLQATAAPTARAPVRRDEVITTHPNNNVSDYIYEKMGINLHLKPSHPIGIIKQAIYDYFDAQAPGAFTKLDDLHPVVSCTANFDEVLVPKDHVSRSPNDTYYVSDETVLR
jgi:phenylalanyl-tRNA synthetase alpha chain